MDRRRLLAAGCRDQTWSCYGSGKGRNDLCSQQLLGFEIVAPGAADEQLHADIAILPDQVLRLRDSAGEALETVGLQPLALGGPRRRVVRPPQRRCTGALDFSVVSPDLLAMTAQHGKFVRDLIGAAEDVAGIGEPGDV